MTREEEIQFRDQCAIAILPQLAISEYTPDDLRERKYQQELAGICFDLAEAMLEEKKKRGEKL